MNILNTININAIKKIAIEAGREILKIYESDFDVHYKEDHSPVTKADIRSNELICTQLKKLYPTVAIISEENADIEYEIRRAWECYWCIDPLDGTKEFIKKSGEFTVNIALIVNHQPVLGVVYAPVLQCMYYAKQKEGAFLETYHENTCLTKKRLPLIKNDSKEGITVVLSQSRFTQETKEFLDKLKHHFQVLNVVKKGSSLKLCLVAQGGADICLCLYTTMEWDTAAAHAIVLESKKNLLEYRDETPLMYNKKELLNPCFVVR